MLLEEARAVGADIMTHAEVVDVESDSHGPQTLVLKDGGRISADVVIGADGTLILPWLDPTENLGLKPAQGSGLGCARLYSNVHFHPWRQATWHTAAPSPTIS